MWMILLTCLVGLGAQQPTNKDSSISGREEALAEEARALVQDLLFSAPTNQTFSGVLIIRGAEGRRSSSVIQHSVRPLTGGWEDVWEVTPPDSGNSERLTITHRGLNPNRYLYWRNIASNDAPTPIQSDKLNVPFGGSDFSAFDLGLEFLHWPKQRIVKQRVTTAWQRPCRVLESSTENPVTGGYAKVLSWIDIESGLLLSAEAFGQEGKKMKRFAVRTIRRNGSLDLEMWNEKKDTMSSLQFRAPE
jgi:hypothetical protein